MIRYNCSRTSFGLFTLYLAAAGWSGSVRDIGVHGLAYPDWRGRDK